MQTLDSRLNNVAARVPVRALGVVILLLVAACAATAWAPESTIASRPHEFYGPGGGLAAAPLIWPIIYAIALLAAFALFLVSLVVIRRAPPRTRDVLVLGAAVQLLPLLAPLMLSTDAWAYWGGGRIAAVLGGSPYVDVASQYPGDIAFGYLGWVDTVTPYGPIWAAFSGAIATVGGADPQVAAWLFRVTAAASMVVVMVVVARLSPRAAFAAAFVSWNPVFAMHFAGAGHNDAAVAAIMVVAIALGRNGRPVGAGLAWSVAALIKWTALVVVPLQLLGDRVGHRRSILPWLLTALLVLAGVATLLFGPAWVSANLSTIHYDPVPGISVWAYLAKRLPAELVYYAPIVLFIAAYLVLLRQALHGRVRRGLAMGLFIAASPLLWAWYTVTPAALSALEDDVPALLVAIVLIAYSGFIYFGDVGDANLINLLTRFA
jgi:hypothetical protein